MEIVTSAYPPDGFLLARRPTCSDSRLNGAIPLSVVIGDLEISVIRSAVIALQSCPGEKQDGDIKQKHSGHSDQDGDVGDESKNANQTQGKCEDDHEGGDLWECSPLVEIFTATDDASTQLPGIVEGTLPVEEDFLTGIDRRSPCRS